MNNLLTRILRSSFIIVLLVTSIASAPIHLPAKESTKRLLQRLGGFKCFKDSIFTCITMDVRLDHFNPSDTRTIPVTFAVHPATGVRKGIFVTATGGPGYSGIASADSYTAAFDPSIPEAFDIVFFDPPYSSDLYTAVPEALSSLSLLSDVGLLVAECSSRNMLAEHQGDLVKVDRRVYGDTALEFFVRESQ